MRKGLFLAICIAFLAFGPVRAARLHATSDHHQVQADPQCDAPPAQLNGGDCNDLADPEDACDTICTTLVSDYWSGTECANNWIGQAEDCQDDILSCSCWPDDLPSGH